MVGQCFACICPFKEGTAEVDKAALDDYLKAGAVALCFQLLRSSASAVCFWLYIRPVVQPEGSIASLLLMMLRAIWMLSVKCIHMAYLQAWPCCMHYH